MSFIDMLNKKFPAAHAIEGKIAEYQFPRSGRILYTKSKSYKLQKPYNIYINSRVYSGHLASGNLGFWSFVFTENGTVLIHVTQYNRIVPYNTFCDD